MLGNAEVIQASLRELYSMTSTGEFSSPKIAYYAQALLAYLRCDGDALEAFFNNCEYSDLKKILKLRWAIVKHRLDQELVSEFKKDLPQLADWEGEAAFILGLAYLDLNEHGEAREAFKLAHKKLWSLGAKKKAVKALLNVVVSEDRLDNSKKCIISYEFVKDKALEVGDHIVAGICYHNIAKEYHKLGGLELSLKYSNQALDYLSEDRGVNHFYEALLQRCHIYIELERFQEALIDFQAAKACKHEKIQEALKAIELLLGDHKEVSLAHLEPAWRTKLLSSKSVIKREKLTKLESQFIELISKSPMTKKALVESLYGDIDTLSADNRFNVFLTRFRKKFQGTVIVEDDLYFLADNSLLEHINHEAI